MRTTVQFDPDTSAAIEALRRDTGAGVSEAVNTLVRRGLRPQPERKPFKVRSYPMGIRIDLTCVADALEVAEGA